MNRELVLVEKINALLEVGCVRRAVRSDAGLALVIHAFTELLDCTTPMTSPLIFVQLT